jgi:hypothetical protein
VLSPQRTDAIAALVMLLVAAAPQVSLAACPAAFAPAQQSCRAITYKDLPAEVGALLTSSGCDVAADSNYDYGVSVALGGEAPAYQFCCHAAPHGPCASALIGKDKGQWRLLAEDVLGYDADPPCNELVVLERQSGGFHDICVASMAPAIRSFDGSRYRGK